MKNTFLMSLIVFVLIPVNLLPAQTEANPPIIDVSHQWEVTNIHGPSQVGISDSIAVDLNSDGWVDVVSASIDDGHIRAYLNPQTIVANEIKKTDLNYTQKIIEENEIGLYRIISTDLNNDGRADLIATSIESHKIFSYTQKIDGGFEKGLVADDILLPTDVGAGDFNGDGLMDLVSLSFENNSVYQHTQQDNGDFLTEKIAKEVLRPRKLTVADWNKDGFADIAVASEEDSSVRVLFNKANDSWDEQLLTDSAIGTRNLTHCDLDQNGLQDLLVSHTGENALVVYYNYGAWPYQPTIIDAAAAGVNAILCHDLNNDGEKDLVAIYAQHSNIYSYFQNQGFTPNLVANTRDGYITLDAADFSHTQQPQILTQTHFQQRNLLYSPSVQNAEQIVWEDFPEGAESVRTGDINGDGIDDIVLGSFRDDTVQWYDGETLQRHVIDNDVDGVNEILVVDLDQDGHVDVLSAASYANSFYFHKNNGQSGFETITIFDDARFANSIEVADIDNDGYLDIIGTSGLDDSVRWIKQVDGMFFVQVINESYDGPNNVAASDFDSNGFIDLVVPNYFSAEIIIYWQIASGVFSVEEIANGVARPYDVLYKYSNNDSLIDFVVIDSSEYFIQQIMNFGDYYESSFLYKLNSSPRELIVNNGLENFTVVTHKDGLLHYQGERLYKIDKSFEGASSVTKLNGQYIVSTFVSNGIMGVSIVDEIFENGFDVQ